MYEDFPYIFILQFHTLPWQKLHLTEEASFTSTMNLHLKKILVKCYIWSIALYGAEIWTLRVVDKKHLENFDMWCWRRMDKNSWTDRMRNEEVLLQVNEQRNILHAIRKRKANWIGHSLRINCLLNQVIEGKIKGEKWREYKEEKVRSYWMTLRTEEDTLIWRRKLWITIFGGIVLEEALNLSSGRLQDDDDYN